MPASLLFGGTSSERFVSCASAQHLAEILPEAPCLFWQLDGSVTSVDRGHLLAHKNPFIEAFVPSQQAVKETWPSVELCLKSLKQQGMSLYLGVHGGDGENGWLQSRCENEGVIFTGSSSKVCELSMDKVASKDVVKKRGVLMAEGLSFTCKTSNIQSELNHFFKHVGSMVIKPRSDGSSVGLSFIKSQDQLDAWWRGREKDASNTVWLCEEMILGRELTVGVAMHQLCLTVLPPSEVILDRDAHFDYQGKYLGKGNKEVTPADLSTKQRSNAQEVSVLSHAALGCFGYTRTDMILNDRGLFYLETNTLPGMTKMSFIPQQVIAAGIKIEDFVRGQIELASNRHS